MICFGFILTFIYFLSAGSSYGSLESIILDLGTYKAKQMFTLQHNTTIMIKAVNIPLNISMLIFEAHAQTEELVMSEKPEAIVHSKVAGKNIGLATKLQEFQSTKSMWLTNNSQQKINALLIISTVDSLGPVPGGCNMEFPTEIAPYLILKSDTMHTYLEYQHASFGYERSKSLPKCSLSLPYITYHVYILFFEENNYSEEEYFRKIVCMSRPSSIREFSSKAISYFLHPDTRYSFMMYPNLGVIYNVVAKYSINNQVHESAYIPIVSYGCSPLNFTKNGCRIQYSVKGKIFLFILSVYAFFIAFFGWSNVGSNIFFFGFLSFLMMGLILFGKYLTFSKQNTADLSIVVGFIGGAFFLILWLWRRNIVTLILLNGLVLGVLLTGAIFYTPLGNLEVLINEEYFWSLFFIGILTVLALSFAIPSVLIILGSSITGTYSMLLFYDDFIGTRLSYIILNVVKRAVSKQNEFAFNNYPFQGKDILMTTSWIVLTLIAVMIWCKQLFFMRSSSSHSSFLSYPIQRPRTDDPYASSEDATFQPLLQNNNAVVYKTFS